MGPAPATDGRITRLQRTGTGDAWWQLTASAAAIVVIALTSSADHWRIAPLVVISLSVNFLIAVGYPCWLERVSLWHRAREVAVPVLPAELFSALLTMGAVYLSVRLGLTGIVLVGLVLAIFQYLVTELLKSKHRGE